jgi:hypothetical protein
MKHDDCRSFIVIRTAIFCVIVGVAGWSYATGMAGKRSTATANPVEQKARKDELFFSKVGDPDMVAARNKARTSLPQFLKIAKSPNRSQKNFAVKRRHHRRPDQQHAAIGKKRAEQAASLGSHQRSERLDVRRKREDER